MTPEEELRENFGLVMKPPAPIGSIEHYRSLGRLLLQARYDDAPEDDILDAMEETWHLLTSAEREELLNEGPQCWPN